MSGDQCIISAANQLATSENKLTEQLQITLLRHITPATNRGYLEKKQRTEPLTKDGSQWLFVRLLRLRNRAVMPPDWQRRPKFKHLSSQRGTAIESVGPIAPNRFATISSSPESGTLPRILPSLLPAHPVRSAFCQSRCAWLQLRLLTAGGPEDFSRNVLPSG
jgi:hypothetical protein